MYEQPDEQYSGLIYPSKLDFEPYFALFEGRFEIDLLSATPLTEDIPELVQVCDEFGLRLT